MIPIMDGTLFEMPAIELTPAQENWGLIGHAPVIRRLRKQLANPQKGGAIGHAYLFTGMSGGRAADYGITFCPSLELYCSNNAGYSVR